MFPRNKVKILITSAGSTNGVNVIKALKEQKETPLFIVAADVNPLAAGLYLADKYYLVPKANSSTFIPAVLKICEKEKIKIIIPTHSFELPFFAKSKNIFEKAGIKIPISSYQTYLITEDKIKTNEYFKKWGIPFPKLYTQNDIHRRKVKFPVIIKPVQASGSQGVFKVNNWKELEFFVNYLKENIVQEYVRGDEYTIDGVCDLESKMIAALPRIRLETKGGLAVKSITKRDNLMTDFTKKIVESFKIVGPFNVQCFKYKNNLKFTEVNSRFPSGGLPLAVSSGLNIPLILIEMLLGKEIKKPQLKYGLAMTRYWDSIILKKYGGQYQPYEQ